jgi:hypothetical protein
MGYVTITREKAPWRDRLRAYEVLLDDRKVGSLRSGETLNLRLEPGVHRLKLKLDWCSSPEFELDGSTEHLLHCKAGGSALMALIDIIFRPNKYISLEMV